MDPFKNKDGKYQHEGVDYEDAQDLIQCGILGFCACGMPEENILYVLKGLELIDEKGPDDPHKWYAWWNEHRARCLAHFGNERSEYFFYYWADAEGLTQHGGCIPGWLQPKTEQLVKDLQTWRDSQKEMQS